MKRSRGPTDISVTGGEMHTDFEVHSYSHWRLTPSISQKAVVRGSHAKNQGDDPKSVDSRVQQRIARIICRLHLQCCRRHSGKECRDRCEILISADHARLRFSNDRYS